MQGNNNYFIWIMLLGLLVIFWLMSRSSRKTRDMAKERAERALVPGNWVVTSSGMYGRVVDIDGSVVILETPDGVETLWDKNAIVMEKEPPFADADGEEEGDSVAEDSAVDVEDASADNGEINEEENEADQTDNPTDSETKK